MAAPRKLTTVLSTKGQVILPASIRRQRQWDVGTRLTVEETPDGVLLRSAPLFEPTTMDQVYGSLAYDGPPRSVEEMDAAVMEEARRSFDRD